jgi:hypothetical protein
MPDDTNADPPSSSAPRPKQHRPASTTTPSVRSRTSPPPGDHDPRPPTKRARKAINCEPCRNSKLKCDRYVRPRPRAPTPPSTLPEIAPAPAVSSEVGLLTFPAFPASHHSRHHCTLLPGCQRPRVRPPPPRRPVCPLALLSPSPLTP